MSHTTPKGDDGLTAYPVIQSAQPQTLPARVVYRIGGGLIPDLTPRPGMDAPVVVALDENELATMQGRTVNGLTVKADAMARFIAHGSSIIDAYRTVYRTKKTGAAATSAASAVTRRRGFADAVRKYTNRVTGETSQTAFGLRDFVMSRLTIEAQDAETDGARIAALKLLGQTEALFVDVRRTERAIDPASLKALKDQLEQRLRAALGRLGQGASLYAGTDSPALEGELAGGDPHPPGSPLVAEGSPLEPVDSIPPIQSSRSGPPGMGLDSQTPPVGVHMETGRVGSPQSTGLLPEVPEEITPHGSCDPADAYVDEFSGPLVTKTL